jgi:hypothetical protein
MDDFKKQEVNFYMSISFTEEQVLSLARMAYREGNAQFAIVPEKCALLVIDMQDEFVKPGWTPLLGTRGHPAGFKNQKTDYPLPERSRSSNFYSVFKHP